jgi:hypothetical protein
VNLPLLIAGWIVLFGTIVVSEWSPMSKSVERLHVRWPRGTAATVLGLYLVGGVLVTVGFLV